jgi:hypothetical protein
MRNPRLRQRRNPGRCRNAPRRRTWFAICARGSAWSRARSGNNNASNGKRCASRERSRLSASCREPSSAARTLRFISCATISPSSMRRGFSNSATRSTLPGNTSRVRRMTWNFAISTPDGLLHRHRNHRPRGRRGDHGVSRGRGIFHGILLSPRPVFLARLR